MTVMAMILYSVSANIPMPVDTDVFCALKEKSRAVAWNRDERREYFIFFSISGYTRQMRALADGREDMLLCT